ncbi:hypothetical protein LH29_24570 [Draconibacterium sediminis]|uniref:Uncharacterized protein n=1 Tax=Draconibacterium sediminis TaxID=1544798 RepID=A0A0D8J3S2_9BACT|nr:hypothetical protein LH29_24570 [Draconibacterium sediminis]
MISGFQLIRENNEKKMSKKGVKVWKYKNLDYFCSRFERSDVHRNGGIQNGKGRVVSWEGDFGLWNGETVRKNFKKYLAETN